MQNFHPQKLSEVVRYLSNKHLPKVKAESIYNKFTKALTLSISQMRCNPGGLVDSLGISSYPSVVSAAVKTGLPQLLICMHKVFVRCYTGCAVTPCSKMIFLTNLINFYFYFTILSLGTSLKKYIRMCS
jgi:hypothetical protein